MAKTKKGAPKPKSTHNKRVIKPKSLTSEEIVFSIMAYIGLLVVVPLVSDIKDKSEFVRFHTKQGLMLLISAVAVLIGFGILTEIPFLGVLFIPISILAYIGLIAVWIIAIIKTIKGEKWLLPLVGEIADKWNI